MIKHNYQRTITHTDYSKIPEVYNSIYSYFYSDRINEFSVPLTFDNLDKKNVIIANDNCLVFNIESEYKSMGWFYPVIPSIFLLTSIITYINEKNIPFFVWFVVITCSIINIGILVCEHKRPIKEYIFDRINGTITFPDLYWKENNTMPFEKVMWLTPTEGNFPGAGGGPNFPTLRIRSPRIYFYSFKNMAYFRQIRKDMDSRIFQSSDELSLLTWYMDKNRPLPPGEIFDEFREKDFKRRKANGFSKPLFRYISNSYASVLKPPYSTLESTDEQQNIRIRIGGW